MKKAITESQLVIPTLMLLAESNGYLTTKTIKQGLKRRLNLHARDQKSYNGRKTTRFENTVGNLISHKTLEKFVKYGTDSKGKRTMAINRFGRKKIYDTMLGKV